MCLSIPIQTSPFSGSLYKDSYADVPSKQRNLKMLYIEKNISVVFSRHGKGEIVVSGTKVVLSAALSRNSQTLSSQHTLITSGSTTGVSFISRFIIVFSDMNTPALKNV